MGRTEHTESSAHARWLFFGLFFFLFTYRSSGGVYWLGLILIGIWWALARPAAPALPRVLYRVAALYSLIWCGHAAWIFYRGEYGLWATLEAYRHYLELLLFIPLSVAFYHARQHLLALMWIPVLAVVVRVLSHTDYGDIHRTFFSAPGFGFGKHYVTFGMHVMIAFLTAIALLGMTRHWIAGRRFRVAYWVTVPFVLLLLFQALVTSGSRSAWLCVLVGLPVLAWLHRRELIQRLDSALAKWVAAGLVLCLVVIGSASLNKIQHRWSGMSDAGAGWFSLDTLSREKDIFPDRRIYLSVFGIERWSERPVLGHGPSAVPVFLSEDPDFHVHPHLHNTYVQVLVEGGVVGAAAVVLLLLAIAHGVWRTRHGAGSRERDLRRWLTVVALCVAVWSLANFHLHNSDWRFTWNWFAAIGALLMRLEHEDVLRG